MGKTHSSNSALARRRFDRHRAAKRPADLLWKRPSRRRLTLELLEDRSLLSAGAQLAFSFTDLGGAALSHLVVGQNFLLKASVQTSAADGVLQAYFNISLNPQSLVAISPAAAIDHGVYTTAPSGDTVTPGLIHEVGGMDLSTVNLPPNTPLSLFSIPCQAVAAGTLALNVALTDNIGKQVFLADSSTALLLSEITCTGTSIAIEHQPPVVTMTAAPLTYVPGRGPVAVDSGISVSDAGSTTLVGATVSIGGNFSAGDLLAFSNQSGITGSWNALTGVMTLSGAASVAAYQTALRSITYTNTNLSPNTQPRTVSVVVNDGASDHNLSAAVARTINIVYLSTTTSVVTSITPADFGQSVTFTAVVAPLSQQDGTPTGTVTFKDGAVVLGTGALALVGGVEQATYATSALGVGTHSITAVYSGDVSFAVSTSNPPLLEVISKADTKTSVATSLSPSVSGQNVTFTATVTVNSPGSSLVASPTGNVAFYDNGIPLGTAPLAVIGGTDQATITISTLATVNHSITALYLSGDANFNSSPLSLPIGQLVNKADTAIVVNSSIPSSVAGQSVTFTATVTVKTPGGTAVSNPTGTVTFYDNGAALGTGALAVVGNVDQATFTTAMGAGTHSITAAYASGDANFKASPISTEFAQVVGKAATTTAVVSSLNPSVFGQAVIFTATVIVTAPGGTAVGSPTGTVTFYDSGTPIGTGALTLVGAADQATYTIASLMAGNHSITAAYTSGDANFAASGPSFPVTQVVGKASTTTTVTSSGNPSAFGHSVTFTATVNGPGGTTASSPTGTVTFYDNSAPIGTGILAVVDGADRATFTTASLGVGTHSVTAAYTSGDANFYASAPSAHVGQVVDKANTATVVTTTAGPSVFGQSVTFTATVNVDGSGGTPLSSPTGTVTFYDNGTFLGTGSLAVVGSADQATCTTATLSVGNHRITAAYSSGDANFNPSGDSGEITHSVGKADTSVAVTSSATPSVFGQLVTFTATINVTGPGSTTVANPTGTITFYDNGTFLANQTVAMVGTLDQATYALPPAVGTHHITAAYTSGDANFNASGLSPAVTQTVTRADTAVLLASSDNPSVAGQSVKFTATIVVKSPGSTVAAHPTGTVTFYDNGAPIGNGTIVDVLGGVDEATFTPTALSTGIHHVTAAYTSGDANFNASDVSPVITQTVNRAGTTTALTSSANPAVFGQSVTLTAAVTVVGPGSTAIASPTGTVIFYDDGVQIGVGALAAADGAYRATCSITTLSFGNHSITASYSGDGNFALSTSAAPLDQAVNRAGTTTTLSSSTNPSELGQSVTFTAAVAINSPGTRAAGGPTGAVTFYDNGSPLGTTQLAFVDGMDQATYTTATLDFGSHQITAAYTSGDSNFNPSTASAAVAQSVRAHTATTVASSVSPSVFGENVVLTATVAIDEPGLTISASPTGTITFYDNGTPIGTGTIAVVGGFNQATCSVSTLGVGHHDITAAYGGDADFTLSTSTSGSLTQLVAKADTHIALTSSGSPSVCGQTVTLTATVTVEGPGSTAAAYPTGTVTFYDGATKLGTAPLAVAGSTDQAVFPTSILTVGTHTITAVYAAGDDNFNPSATLTPIDQAVNKADTTTAVTLSLNPSVFGQAVTITAAVTVAAPGSTALAGPTGTVVFYDDGVMLGSNSLAAAGGVDEATFTTAVLGVGVHHITALYIDGDENFNPSALSPAATHVVQTDTATVVLSASNPSMFGQSVTFTATVMTYGPGNPGTPTGTVTFMDGALVLGTGTLAVTGGQDQATFTTSLLSVGNHVITAVYGGDADFARSTSDTPVQQVVHKADTIATIASSANPSAFGQSITLTANVTAASPGSTAVASPTGTVVFYDNGAMLGSGTLVPVAGGSHATYTTSTRAVGHHSITAVYIVGDGNFNSSQFSSPIDQVVDKASTTTTVASSTNPSLAGQSVTFTATVAVTAPGTADHAHPTGTVTFYDNGVPIGAGTLAFANGLDKATCTTSPLSAGHHSITAAYTSGDDNFLASSVSSAVTQVVQAHTTTTVVSSANPAVFGESVVFTATVAINESGSQINGHPTGTVTFYDNGAPIGSGALAVVGGVDQATLAAGPLGIGNHSITAAYGGDTDFAAGTMSNALNQVVGKAATSAAVVSSSGATVSGQDVTFTATVTVNGPGTTAVAHPTGTVTFYDNGTAIGTGTLALLNGVDQATCTTSLLHTGSHSITATYTSGDTNFTASLPSTAISQAVGKAATTAVVASSASTTVSGESVTFMATITVSGPGSTAVAHPTGTVTFYDNGTAIGTGTLSLANSLDQATYTTSSLSTGSHSITAAYTTSDENFSASPASAPLPQTVGKAATSAVVVSSAATTVSGQSVTFTATVVVTGHGTTTVAHPTGTVTFYDNGAAIGTGTLSLVNILDQATYTTTSLGTGSHSITAAYTSGDTNFSASPSSVPITQTVGKAATTAAVASSASTTVSGESVTFVATITVSGPGSTAVAHPTGTVTFYDNGTAIGTGTLSFANSLNQTTYTTSSLSTGSHSITAAYTSGDTNFSASPASAAITQTIGKAATTAAVASSAGTTVSGQSATFTATVTVSGPGSTAVAHPTGTVTFYDNGTAIGTGTVALASGVDQATYTTSSLGTGTHSITAAYTSGDSNFSACPSSVAITQTVGKAATTAAIASSAGSTVSGQSVTFTATVTVSSPGSTAVAHPTGTVTFYDNGTAVGTGAVALVGGVDQATFATSSLTTGSHLITAAYTTTGDSNFTASPNSVAITQTVGKAATTATVASSAAASVSGQSVTFTATLAITNPGTTTLAHPTGTVTFYDNGTAIGTGAVAFAGGVDQATYTTSSLSTGSHSITAAYTSGDTNFSASPSSAAITQTVDKAAATATVASSAAATTAGQSVTFTATVAITSPGTTTVAHPTGTVTFYDNGTLIGTATLSLVGSVDQATYTTSTLAAGSHSITAAYTSGDANFSASPTSAAITQTVDAVGGSSLSGVVYIDSDNDGRNAATGGQFHVGIPGVAITLTPTSASGQSPQFAITGADGSYHFDNLSPGTYQIQESAPMKYLPGKSTAGSAGGAVAMVSGNATFSSVALASGQQAAQYNFGHLGLRAEYISLRLFLASNATPAKQVQEIDEPPVVRLSGTAAVNYSTTLPASGVSVPVANPTAATVTKADDGWIQSMTVTIENRPDGASETLAADMSVLGAAARIKSAYTAGVLTLTGPAPAADFQTVLRTVKYSNSAPSPTSTTRTVTILASDKLKTSATATTTLSPAGAAAAAVLGVTEIKLADEALQSVSDWLNS